MKLSNYQPTHNQFWTGRVDDPEDQQSYRMHQVVKLLDLNKIEDVNLKGAKLNICMLGFCCDEGI